MRVMARTGAFVALIVAVGLGLAACQTQGTATRITTGNGDIGPASWLSKPEGDGPFPAVVLAHGCSGTEKNTSHQTVWRGLNRHATLLNGNGYVTLIVDSFGPRRISDGCQTGGKYYPLQVSDAHAAFDHLASLPFVDGKRIGFVGLSLGGGTALQLALRTSVDFRAKRGKATYAALVAYYPWCESAWAYSLTLPVLILVGAEDDWTPAWRCSTLHALAEKSRNKPVVELTVYSGAHHSFDLPMQGPYYVDGMNGAVHTVQGNAGARRASQVRMLDFFQKYLGGSSPSAGGKTPVAMAHSGGKDFFRVTTRALVD